MSIEDVWVALAIKLAKSRTAFSGSLSDAWRYSFVFSIADHIQADTRPLSTNQCRVILKILHRVRDDIVADGLATANQIDQLLKYPRYRREPYASAQIPREARYAGDNKIALRCKADPMLTAAIKALGDADLKRLHPASPYNASSIFDARMITRSRPNFNWEHKVWLIPVHHHNLQAINNFLSINRFHLDSITEDYLATCGQCYDRPAVITFADHHRDTLIVSVPDNDILAGWIIDVANGIVL